MQTLLLLLVSAMFVPYNSAYSSGGFTWRHSTAHMTAQSTSRSEVLKRLGTAVTGLGAAIASGVSVPPASADNTLAGTKRSYFRYVPRILESMDWYQGDLRKAVFAQDWPKVLTYFEVTNTSKKDSKRPELYQSTSTRFERELYSPLTVWAQSFSVKGTGPRLRELLAQEKALENSMSELQDLAAGSSGKEGSARAEAAKAAWEAGRAAIQTYTDVANVGMVRQLRKIETPFSK